MGIGLPEGRRLGALFALVSGAGVGLASLGLLTLILDEGEPSASTFFVASPRFRGRLRHGVDGVAPLRVGATSRARRLDADRPELENELGGGRLEAEVEDLGEPAPEQRAHLVDRDGRPASRLIDVAPCPGRPQATIPSKYDRSKTQFTAKPQRHAGAEQPDADRAHLVVAEPYAGLNVLPPVQPDPEVGADADHRLLHPAEMRGGGGGGTQIEDRVSDQLARTVERELPTAIDAMDLGAARGQLLRGPQELIRRQRGAPP